MKIKYQVPKGHRIKKQFIAVELDPDSDYKFNYMYFEESHEWRRWGDFKDGEIYASSSCHCRSLKAAIRKIKKWNFPKGTKFRLCSMWVGHDIYITV